MINNTMPIKVPSPKPLLMKRVNTRILQSQDRFIKARAKATGETEGEIFRDAVRNYIKFNKKHRLK